MKKLILVALFAASTAAQSAWYSGGDLHKWWATSERNNHRFVAGYIMAIASLENLRLFCIPSTETEVDILKTVTRQLFLFSELRETLAHIAVVNALQRTYPCKVIEINKQK